MVAAYLVGTRGKPRHAFMLGGTVTAAHTAGVFAIGFVTLAPLAVHRSRAALSVAHARVRPPGRGRRHRRAASAPARATAAAHHHHHDHAATITTITATGTTTITTTTTLTSKGILGVGIAAGLLPCPSALVVLLSAIALHRVGLGLALIVAFSVGLAATITAIGLVAVLARRAFGRLSLERAGGARAPRGQRRADPRGRRRHHR